MPEPPTNPEPMVYQLRVVLRGVSPLEPRRYYPVCVGGRRTVPPEDCGEAWAFLEFRQHYSAFRIAQRLLELLKPITIADDRLLRWLKIDRFDRRAANRELACVARAGVA